MKLSCQIRVKNPLGLHARPAGSIVKLLQKSSSVVSFTYKGNTVNAKSIMGILTLGAVHNAFLTVDIEGEDAQETMQCLLVAFDRQFGEEHAVK